MGWPTQLWPLHVHFDACNKTNPNTIDLEMTMLSENGETRSVEVMASELYTTHIAGAIPKLQPAPDAFSITVSYMVQMLSQKFGALSDTLRPKLKSVSHKVSSGYITTTRRLELELLQAGKLTLSSTELFDEYIPEVRNLCDPIYDQRASNPRTKYHRLGCSLVESMIENIVAPNAPVINSSSSAQDQSNTHDFPLDLNDDSDALAEFLKDFDNAACSLYVPSETPLGDIMRSTALASENAIENTTTVPEQTNSHSTIDPASLSRNGSDNETAHPTRKDKERASPHDYITHSPIPPLTSTPPLPELVHSPSMIDGTASVQTAAANGCCEICGYRPKGDPQWFKGSMAKHKKLQHSTDPPRIYRCMYPGCNSAYKNRADNLRQHQIEKGHFVDGETKQKKSGKRKKMDEDE